MKFKTTEWTLNMHYAAEIAEHAGRPNTAKTLRQHLAWILTNIAEIEAIDGRDIRDVCPKCYDRRNTRPHSAECPNNPERRIRDEGFYDTED